MDVSMGEERDYVQTLLHRWRYEALDISKTSKHSSSWQYEKKLIKELNQNYTQALVDATS
jgi:hypothetical protein